ncbi:hypothetical protein [Saccharothrix stipae]
MRRKLPETIARSFPTGPARTDGARRLRNAEQRLESSASHHRHDDPPSSAGRTAERAVAAHITKRVRRAPSVPDGAEPAPQTWRRRIAEQFVHQEGVSL